jgi:hypothetical protein
LRQQAKTRDRLRLDPAHSGPVGIQCKWRAAAGDPEDFHSFSNLYPTADRWILAADRTTAITRTHKKKPYTETGLDALSELISKHSQQTAKNTQS